jgi:hypothetical protein
LRSKCAAGVYTPFTGFAPDQIESFDSLPSRICGISN